MGILISLVLNFYNKFRNIILYGVIGSFSASVDFGVFSLLTQTLSIHYIPSNILSVCFGIITSFYLNKSYNFKVHDKVFLRFLIFLSVGLLGLALSSFSLFLFIEFFSFNLLISKLISISIVVFIQFLLNKYISFKKFTS